MHRSEMLFTGAALTALGPKWSSPAMATSGFYVPAEEEHHDRTFMQWPVSRRVYTDRWHLADVQKTIANIANSLAAFEPVVMLAAADHHKAARKPLSDPVQWLGQKADPSS